MRFLPLSFLISLLWLVDPLFADVRLPNVLSDRMVLQREKPIRLWGWAAPAENITITLNGKSVLCNADKQGEWNAELPAMKAGGPYEIIIEGKNKIKLVDVLIGDVWFCSGQSNMALGVVKTLDHEKEIANANYPKIRLLTSPNNEQKEPATDLKVDWQICSPKTISYFSATAYYFGRELHQKNDVPIGLIVSAVNGTRIEPWTSGEGVQSVKELVGKDKAENGALYNGMIHPFTKFGIRGVIWYQGEGNVGDGMIYAYRMRALVNGWRKAWGLDEFPFYYVQITPLNWGGKPKEQHAELWEAQSLALQIPHTGMIVTNDIGGHIGDAHPKNKQEVGRRLSLLALAKTYGKTETIFSGPVYKSMSIEGNAIRLQFDHTHGGLVSRDGKPLTWFTIAGADGVFVPAKAEIDGKDILVTGDTVTKPVAVRFAWHQNATPNLMNKEGFPVSAFRTDRPDGLPAPSGPKYQFKEIMVIVYADFPNQKEHQEALAKYTVEQGFNCVEVELDKLDVCRKAGLKARLGDIDVNKLLKAAPSLKDDPIVLGYFVSDRRSRDAFPKFSAIAREFEKADPNHPTLYINRAEYNQFPEFVDVVKPMVLDYYHYHWYHKNHPERYYLYLKMFRDLSVKHQIPQMRCLGSNNPPAQIRQSMYVPLAYGVQAFHFWPPWFVSCKMDKDRNAVLEDGKPVFGLSDQAKTVSEVAKELKHLSPILVKLTHVAAYHTDEKLPIGAEKAPENLWLQPSGETFLVSLFQDEDKNQFLMPVNHGVDKARELTIQFSSQSILIEVMDRKKGEWKNVPLEKTEKGKVLKMTINPGDGELLRVRNR